MQKQLDIPEFRGNIGNFLTPTNDELKQMLAASAEMKRQRQEYAFQQDLFRNEVLQQVQMEIEQTEILQAQISQKLKNLKDFLRVNNFHQQQAQLFEQMREFRKTDYLGQSERIVAGGQLNQSYAGESNQLQETLAAKILPNSPEVFQQQGRFQLDQICGINMQQLRSCASEEKQQSQIDQISLVREETNNQAFKIDQQQKIMQLQPSPLLGISQNNCNSQTPNSFNHVVTFSHGAVSSQSFQDMNLAEQRNFQNCKENIQQLQPLQETRHDSMNTESFANRQPSLQNKLFNSSCPISQTQEKPFQTAEKTTQKQSKIFPKIEESLDQSPSAQQVSPFEEQQENLLESQSQKRLHIEEVQEQRKNGGQQKRSLAAMAPQLLNEIMPQLNAQNRQLVSPQEMPTYPAPLSLSIVPTPDQKSTSKMSGSFLKNINEIMTSKQQTPMNQQQQINQSIGKIHDLAAPREGIFENGNAETFTGKQINEDSGQNQSMKNQTTSAIKPQQGETNQMKNLLKGFKRRMRRSYSDSTDKRDNFLQYFDNFKLGNELILNLLKEGTPYYEDFQLFLREDPIWWIQEAKIQDVSRQINFFNKVISKKYSKLKTKCKNNKYSEEQLEGHSNHSLNIRSSITLTDQMDERDNFQQFPSSQYSG